MNKVNHTDIPDNLYEQLYSSIQPDKVAVLYTREQGTEWVILETWKAISFKDASEVLCIQLDTYINTESGNAYMHSITCRRNMDSEPLCNMMSRPYYDPLMLEILVDLSKFPNMCKIYDQMRKMAIKSPKKFKERLLMSTLREKQRN